MLSKSNADAGFVVEEKGFIAGTKQGNGRKFLKSASTKGCQCIQPTPRIEDGVHNECVVKSAKQHRRVKAPDQYDGSLNHYEV